jgi:hypothetical protein
VPVEKKESGKLRVCIDFCNLNRATPKDEYLMPIADKLINNASRNKIISFLDSNAGYNHIFMAEEDASKTAFICPRFIGLFEWVVIRPGQKEPEPRNRTEITENRNRTNRTEGTVMNFGSGFLRTEINEIFSVLHSKEPKEPKNPKVLDSICYMCL